MIDDIIIIDKGVQNLKEAIKEYSTYICDMVILVIDVTSSYDDDEVYDIMCSFKKNNISFMLVVNKIDLVNKETLASRLTEIKMILAEHDMTGELCNFNNISIEPCIDNKMDIRSIPILPISSNNVDSSHKLVKAISNYAQARLYSTILQTNMVNAMIMNVQIREEFSSLSPILQPDVNESQNQNTLGNNQGILLMMLSGTISIGDYILINIDNEACILYVRQIWVTSTKLSDKDRIEPIQSVTGANIIYIQTYEEVDLLSVKIETENYIEFIDKSDLYKVRQLYRDIRHLNDINNITHRRQRLHSLYQTSLYGTVA